MDGDIELSPECKNFFDHCLEGLKEPMNRLRDDGMVKTLPVDVICVGLSCALVRCAALAISASSSDMETVKLLGQMLEDHVARIRQRMADKKIRGRPS